MAKIRRSALDRAVEHMLEKHRDVADYFFYSQQSRTVYFKGRFYKEAVQFNPYTEYAKIVPFFNRCARHERMLAQVFRNKEVSDSQPKLI